MRDKLTLRGAREHNLKGIDVAFPLHMLTVVTGVSGSGKTTLVKRILYLGHQAGDRRLQRTAGRTHRVEGDIERIQAVEMVDQNPIGRSSRSNW